jgi:glycine/D-amino acid oxidase-like deaminating enzyme
MKVIIIGGGLIGVTTAYFLMRHGHEVTVVDRQAGPGRETSFANGALLTPSMAGRTVERSGKLACTAGFARSIRFRHATAPAGTACIGRLGHQVPAQFKACDIRGGRRGFVCL